MQPEKLLTITDVSERLQVERHKASALMKLMPCLVMPGTRTKRVRAIDLESWIIENRVVQAEELRQPAKRRKHRAEPVGIDQEYFEPDGRLKRRKV